MKNYSNTHYSNLYYERILMRFYNREKELTYLRTIGEVAKKTFRVTIIGRCRIGKTKEHLFLSKGLLRLPRGVIWGSKYVRLSLSRV